MSYVNDDSNFDRLAKSFLANKCDFTSLQLKKQKRKISAIVVEDRVYEKLLNDIDLSMETSRTSIHREKNQSWKILGIFMSSIVLDAVGDGLSDNGNKVWGHGLQAASTGVLLAAPFIIDVKWNRWGYYLASYLAIRIAVFDPAYNLSRGLDIGYVGNTSLWDKGMQQIKPPAGAQMFGRAVFLTAGISMTFQEL